MDNGYVIIIIMFIILIIICDMSLIEKFETYIVSKYDNNSYKVQDYPNKESAADILAKIRENIEKLIKHLNDKYPNNTSVKRLNRRLNLENISEGKHENNTTSYTINKGELISLCIREKDKNKQLHRVNELMFVVIHELAHIMSVSEGHTDEFMIHFKLLLQEANDCGSYIPINYKENPMKYCGMTVTNNPYFSKT